MQETWHFSPESAKLVQNCVSVALSDEKSRKWLSKLRREKSNKTLAKKDSPDVIIVEESESEEQALHTTNRGDSNTEFESSFFIENLTSDSNLNIDYLVVECSSNPKILQILAEKASPLFIEQLCSKIFTQAAVNQHLVEHFYHFFLPIYLKQGNSRHALDILDKASFHNHDHFKPLILTLLKDSQTQILHDYVMNLNEVRKTEFLNLILYIDSDIFSKNLLTIYTAYKDCIKSNGLQSFLITNLFLNKTLCSGDRDFGRLLLTFLQAEKSNDFDTDKEKIGKVIEMHQSPFARPCMNLYKELLLNKKSNT